MYWIVHWNNYMPVDEVEDWRGQLDDNEQSVQLDDYYSAFGRFINVVSNSDVGRCWVTVHKGEEDKEGNVMFAYSNRWEDTINIEGWQYIR